MIRLDQALVDRGLCASREQARRAVMAGRVRMDGQVVDKPGRPVSPRSVVQLITPERYVSRGGLKLEHGLKAFGLDVRGWVAIDLGASTGGFTDCLLQHGAARVYAVDVGQGQLAWRLRRDPRVVVMERTNARHLTRESFPPGFAPADLVVIDCSFISLRLLFPSAIELLRPLGRLVALVKPQFEAGKAEADRGRGVITDPRIHERVLTELRAFVTTRAGVAWRDVTDSPIRGPAGNQEFLVLIEKSG